MATAEKSRNPNMQAGAGYFADDLVKSFSGQDKTYTVSKWIQDLDDNAEIFMWTALQQLIIARRSLVGTAALWLQSERPFKSWDELKVAIAKEFPDVLDQKTAHEMMSSRKKQDNESCMDYLLVMRELGKRGKMPDYVAIKYIVDGIEDEETHKIMLYGVTTYPDLKEKIKIYETLKGKIKESKVRRSQPKYSSDVVGKRVIRCFSCGERSHQSKECPNKHLGLKCFKCNDFGHIAPLCNKAETSDQAPNKFRSGGDQAGATFSRRQQHPTWQVVGEKTPGGVSASSDTKRTMFSKEADNVSFKSAGGSTEWPTANEKGFSTDLSTTNKKEYNVLLDNDNDVNKDVSIGKPRKTVKIFDKATSALIDTGSDVNLISKEFYTMIGSPKSENNFLSLFGFGHVKVCSMGKIKVPIVIDEQSYSDVCFHVVSNDSMPYEIIIGHEFLKDVTLFMKDGNIMFLPSNENWLCKLSCYFTDVPYVIGGEVSKHVQHQVKHLVEGYQPMKTKDAPVRLHIILKDDIPVAQRPRRLAISEQEEVERQVEQWLKEGIVRVSWSEYASPLVLVRKKDGAIRICVDYRLINKKMLKDEYPLPIIDDHIDRLAEAKIFCTIDLKNAYFHLPVHEDSIKYTAFVTHNGQYEFLKAPFGLTVCPKAFTRFITTIFHELISRRIVLIFIDDLLITAQNELEAVERLKEVLDVASQYGLDINWKKSQLVVRRVEYLGHIIEDGQVKPSSEKTDAVKRFPEPRNTKQLQSFIGLTSYFRKYIQNFSLIAKPLTDLLKKDSIFKFNQEQMIAFETLKEKLSNNPVLKIYNPKSYTELHTDASVVAYAAILMQRSDDDGSLHPIYYMSRKTSEAESRYSSYELEALAVIEGIKKFRKYLFGKKFKIVTDCQAFQMTLEKKDMATSPRVARWIMLLQEYDFTIEHRSGSQMRHADALSRYPYVAQITSDFYDRLKDNQAKDTVLKAIIEILKDKPYDDFWLENDILFKGPEKHLVVPKNMEMDLIRSAHENGHFGKKKTIELLRKDYYIKSMDRKVEEYIQTCIPCLLASRKAGKQEGLLSPIDKGELPLDTLHLDHIGPMTATKKQYNHILTVIDAFTKFTWIFPTKSTTSREVIAKLQVHQQVFGNPRRIITDRGTAFTSGEFTSYCKDEKIEHITITTGIPRANGQVERIHRVMVSVLTKLCIEQPGNWFKHVSRLQQALNSTYQRSVNAAPYELLIGTKMRRRTDPEILDLIQQENQNIFMNHREELRMKAKEQILKVQDENRRNFNKTRKKSRVYQVGDVVAIRRTQFGVGMKLRPKYLGPYRVTKVKGADRYDVAKLDSATEGPNKTSSAADSMKPWPSMQENDADD